MAGTQAKGVYAPGERFKKVRPVESREYFPNPHKGMMTFQHFHGDPPTPPPWSEEGPIDFPAEELSPREAFAGCLPSTVAYCRWFWSYFEPERGRFRWDMVEGALRKAQARGQTLHVRLQSFGSKNQPQLPDWFQACAPTQRNSRGYIDPVYDSQQYLECWTAVLRSFAEQFDGRPGMDVLDVAFVGPWGEGAGQTEGLISRSRIDEFVEAYIAAFKHIHLVVNGGPQFDAGTRRGTGWRVDSFADVASGGCGVVPDGVGWNHMYDAYPKMVATASGRTAWERGPVSFEWGQSLEYLREKNHPLDFIIQQGLKYHASFFFMPRNLLVPDGFHQPLMEFAKRMGYRLVLRQFHHERRTRPYEPFGYSLWIENIGVAPLYHHYPLAFRFSQGTHSAVMLTPHDPRAWLPGDTWIADKIELPAFSAGEVMIHVALVDPVTKTPRVKFAVEGADADGWLPLDTVEVSV